MSRPANKLLLGALLMFCAAPCFAERADRDKPVYMEADQVLIDDAQQTSTFIGNVQMTQGTLRIRGDKIVVTQDKDGFKHGTAYGRPASYRQKREGLDEYVEGYGNRIEYDTRADTVDFYEQARITRNQDEVRGEHITYNAKTEIFKVDRGTAEAANGPAPRVHAVLQPKPKEGAAPRPAPAAAPPGSKPSPTE